MNSVFKFLFVKELKYKEHKFSAKRGHDCNPVKRNQQKKKKAQRSELLTDQLYLEKQPKENPKEITVSAQKKIKINNSN